jgi:hypothetical protein
MTDLGIHGIRMDICRPGSTTESPTTIAGRCCHRGTRDPIVSRPRDRRRSFAILGDVSIEGASFDRESLRSFVGDTTRRTRAEGQRRGSSSSKASSEPSRWEAPAWLPAAVQPASERRRRGPRHKGGAQTACRHMGRANNVRGAAIARPRGPLTVTP